MTAAAIEANVRTLIEAADRALAQGKAAEAAQLLAQAQTTAPSHPLVLSALGLRALREGRTAQAREHLQHAVELDQKNPTLWLNYALACRASGDAAAELTALDHALALDPYFYLALLQKATLMERQNNLKEAAKLYHAFLCCVPNTAPAGPALQAAMNHARKAVLDNSRELEEFLQQKLQRERERHSEAHQDRFNACVDVFLGKKRVYVQQPTFMHFPHVPAIQFYDRKLFSWMDYLEQQTERIREELSGLMSNPEEFVPYVANPPGTPLNQWRELNHSRRWGAFYLWRDGKPVDENLARCPQTARLLNELPLTDVPGHAPNAFFSLLQPKTKIPPHTGVTNTRLVVHLPLAIPESCGFRVGYETRTWRVGTAWVFDDTIEHEAWNDSDEARAILIFDIWNPYLSEAERDLVRVATVAVADFYQHPARFSAGL